MSSFCRVLAPPATGTSENQPSRLGCGAATAAASTGTLKSGMTRIGFRGWGSDLPLAGGSCPDIAAARKARSSCRDRLRLRSRLLHPRRSAGPLRRRKQAPQARAEDEQDSELPPPPFLGEEGIVPL